MYLAQANLGNVHDFVFYCINMLKNTMLPYGGISFWTLYCGIFYVSIMATVLRMLLGLGGGDIRGGNLLGLGHSAVNLKGNMKYKEKKDAEKAERNEKNKQFWKGLYDRMDKR